MLFATLRRFGIISLLVILLVASWSLLLIGNIDAAKVLALIQSEPTLAPISFILVIVVSSNLLLPFGLGLALGSGILWGGLMGGAWTTLGSLLAALTGYLLSSLLGERHLKGLLESASSKTFFHIFKQNDWWLIFLVRLNPILPFGLQNYLFGLSGIPIGRYAMLSLLSCAIPSFIYAYIGASLKSLALTGEIKNPLMFIGCFLLLFTISYLTKLYFRLRIVSN
jgi:uncharacterized membrane protein YdjX (TVP38/TMEM64 family)